MNESEYIKRVSHMLDDSFPEYRLDEGLIRTLPAEKVKRLLDRNLPNLVGDYAKRVLMKFYDGTEGHFLVKYVPCQRDSRYYGYVQFSIPLPAAVGAPEDELESLAKAATSKLFSFMNNIGYSFAGWYFPYKWLPERYDERGNKTEEDAIVNMSFEAKYTADVSGALGEFCFHISPTSAKAKILRQGLTPHSKSNVNKYDDRVYMFAEDNVVPMLSYAVMSMKNIKNLAFGERQHLFTIYKIMTSSVSQPLYVDEFMPGTAGAGNIHAVWTYGNVRPSAIVRSKDIDLNSAYIRGMFKDIELAMIDLNSVVTFEDLDEEKALAR